MSSPEQVFKTTIDEAHHLVTVYVQGYFNDVVGEKLWTTLRGPLESGNINVVIDMSGCNLINSMGIGKLLETVIDIDENFSGQTVFTGLSVLFTEALTVSGVLTVAQAAPDHPRAIELAKMKK